jgi:heat shock protein HtpX
VPDGVATGGWPDHSRRNIMQSAVLLGGIGLLLVIAVSIVWGITGAIVTAAVLGGIFVLAPRVPPEAVMKLYRATYVVPTRDSQLSSLVEVLAFRAGLTVLPKLYVIPSMTMNAFATGSPEHSAIAITEGLLRRLTLREISGVLAHEISHIRSNDLEVMGLADVMTRFLQLLSYVALGLAVLNLVAMLSGEQVVSWWTIILLYTAPAVSSLLQLGLSRAREFDADREAALLTGDAMGLASALRQLETYTGRFWEDLMFPVPARRVPQPSLLRTHPTNEERVSRLLSLPPETRHDPIVIVEQPMVSLVGVGPIEMRPRYRWPGLWY